MDLKPYDSFSDANKVGAPRDFRRGEVIQLSSFEDARTKGYHTWSPADHRQFKDLKGNADAIHYSGDDALEALWPPTETPPPEPFMEEGTGALLEHRKPFIWTQDLYIKPDAKVSAEHFLRFSITVLLCNDTNCFPPTQHDFQVPFKIIDSPVVPPPADLAQRLQFTPPPPEPLNFQGRDHTVVSLLPAVKPAVAMAAPDHPPQRVGDNPNGDQQAQTEPGGGQCIIRQGRRHDRGPRRRGGLVGLARLAVAVASSGRPVAPDAVRLPHDPHHGELLPQTIGEVV